jgi:hypothetical protein
VVAAGRLTIMALLVPVSAAAAVPRRFGVAMLAGWIVVAASVFVTLLGLAVVAVPFARARQ